MTIEKDIEQASDKQYLNYLPAEYSAIQALTIESIKAKLKFAQRGRKQNKTVAGSRPP